MARFAVAVTLCLLAGSSALQQSPKDTTHFLATEKKAAANAEKVATTPALQPHDTYDEDFPVTNRGLTPTQLKYQAQADYAKAVAEMKMQESDTVAAKSAAASALAKHKAALRAAKEAELARQAAVQKAEAAKAAVEAARAKVAAVKGDASADAAQLEAAEADLTKQKGTLDAAKKAVEEAEAGVAAAEEALKAKEKKLAEIRKELQKLEQEQAEAAATVSDAGGAVDSATAQTLREQQSKLSAEKNLAAKKASYEAEIADEEAAKAAEIAAKDQLKHAEGTIVNGTRTSEEKAALINTTKLAYQEAHGKYLKETEDVELAKKRVAVAKQELAKVGVVLGAAVPRAAAAGLVSLMSALVIMF